MSLSLNLLSRGLTLHTGAWRRMYAFLLFSALSRQAGALQRALWARRPARSGVMDVWTRAVLRADITISPGPSLSSCRFEFSRYYSSFAAISRSQHSKDEQNPTRARPRPRSKTRVTLAPPPRSQAAAGCVGGGGRHFSLKSVLSLERGRTIFREGRLFPVARRDGRFFSVVCCWAPATRSRAHTSAGRSPGVGAMFVVRAYETNALHMAHGSADMSPSCFIEGAGPTPPLYILFLT
jgi:hypothetical protein